MSVSNNGISGGGDLESGIPIGSDTNPDKLLSQSIKMHNENSR